MIDREEQTTYGARRRGRPKKVYKRPNKPLCEFTKDEVWHEGEHLAAEHLEKIGMEIIERNWRCAAGEADIVALDDSVVVLVEVKSRRGSPEDNVFPEVAVDEEKRRRYRKMAAYYITLHPDIHSVRFDVIAVNLISDRHAKLRRITNAMSWDD